MTREEATALCARLRETHADRFTHQWRPRQDASGDWTVLKIALPERRDEDRRTEQRADERPPSADDPRPAFERNVGGPWAGGV